MDAYHLITAFGLLVATALILLYVRSRPAWIVETTWTKRVFAISTIWGITVFLVILVTFQLACAWARSYVSRQAQLAKNEPAIVYVDGTKAADPISILDAVGQLRLIPAHHSHPENEKEVRFACGTRSLSLLLSQDSERPGEIWVFWPAFFSGPLEIGRTTSPKLAGSLWPENDGSRAHAGIKH